MPDGDLIQHYYYFLATDSMGQAVLDGQIVNLALTEITGGATITGRFGSNTVGEGAYVAGAQRTKGSWRSKRHPLPQPRRVWNKR